MVQSQEFDPRVRLSMDLGGEPFESAETTSAVYRGLLAAMEPRFLSTLSAIRRLAAHEIVLARSCSDDVASLVQMCGARVDITSPPRIDLSSARLAVFGCFGHASPVSGDALGQFLSRGGVLVTSDKAIARLPIPAHGLHVDEPAQPQRGRLVVSRQSTRGWNRVSRAGSLFATAVTMEAGHIPIDAIPEAGGVVVLAHEALGGRPIAVVVPVGNGWLVHSVTHWYQCPPGLPTDVERRPIETMERHIKGVDVPKDASVGLYLAAQAMLFTLLSGVEIAFRGEGFDVAPGRP